jgi:hypothetical protein
MAAQRFAGVALSDTRISFDGQSVPVRGARAYVEEDGEVVRRESLSRVLPGLLRDVLRGPDHPRELFLLVEGPGFHFVVPCDPTERAEARAFASAICVAGSRPKGAPVERGAGPGFPRSALTVSRTDPTEVGASPKSD